MEHEAVSVGAPLSTGTVFHASNGTIGSWTIATDSIYAGTKGTDGAFATAGS